MSRNVRCGGLLAFGFAFLLACGSSSSGPSGPRFNGQTATAWETLTAMASTAMAGDSPGFSDYSPSHHANFYFLQFSTLAVYDGAGTWTDLASPPDDMGDWPGPAWVGDHLYIIRNNKVYAYSISNDSWSTVLDTGVPDTQFAQMTQDSSGNVWAVESSGLNRIIKYDPTDNSITPYDSGGLGGYISEPRVGWDSVTMKLYVAPAYDAPLLFAFDPATQAVTAKASAPAVGGGTGTGIGDSFCSDRSGHLYAIGDTGCDASASMFQYDTASDTWAAIPDVPFSNHGCWGACTVTDNGWLYFTDGNSNFSRLQLH
jgi:hypothetical protein